MPTIKIYNYMKKLDLEKEFFGQLFWRLAAMAFCAVAAFFYGQIYFSVCVSSFWAYSFFHHFFQNKDLYQLRSEYKQSDLSPEDALEQYQTEICMIHTENHEGRLCWNLAFLAALLPLVLPQLWYLGCIMPLFLFCYEYKESDFYD